MLPAAISPGTLSPPHRRALESLIADAGINHPEWLAILLGGSLIKGTARADSDLDVTIVFAEAAYARRLAAGELSYYTTDGCGWEGGYVDAKAVNRAFLQDVADRGSEAARSAYVGAWPAWSRDGNLASWRELIARIAVYPEDERVEKMRAFHAQILAWQWFAGEARKRGELYLGTRAAAELVLFAARLLLAHNRVIYPFHKWMMLYRGPSRRASAGLPETGRNAPASPAGPDRRGGVLPLRAGFPPLGAAGPGLEGTVHRGQRMELARGPRAHRGPLIAGGETLRARYDTKLL